ncbi:MAG: aldo/keto reductase [Acidimicrobiales bacterium]|nr:aldo/keto reductase [Acidimicrobiales bacterium]
MEYVRLGRTGLRVSEVCLGAMTFARESDEVESRAMIDRFLDVGGTFIDTADVYAEGASEELVGRALAGRRDDVVLATKVRFPMGSGPNDAGLSRRHVLDGLHASLRRLGTDFIDLYQVHCWDPTTPLEETLSALDDAVRAGKVRYLGASNFTAWQLAKANGVAERHGWEPFVSLQPQYSLAVRDLERELLPLCRHDGIAVLPWSPLGGGLLTGKYRPGEEPPAESRAADGTPSAALMRRRLTERNLAIAEAVRTVAGATGHTSAQVALNWVITRPGVTAPIIGARTVEQLDENLGAMGWRLAPEHEAVLDEASAIELGYPHDFQLWAGAR